MKNIFSLVQQCFDKWYQWLDNQYQWLDDKPELLVPQSTYDQVVWELQNEKNIHQFYVTREKQLLEDIKKQKEKFNDLSDVIAMCDDEILQVAKAMLLNKSFIIKPDDNTEINTGEIKEISVCKGMVTLKGKVEYTSTLSHLVTISNIKQPMTWQ